MTPLINGISYAWGNVSLVLFGVSVSGITKISYSRKQKKDNNYGLGSVPVSRGYGNVDFEGSIEIYTEEWKRIIASSPNRDPLQIPPFDVQIVFALQGQAPDKDVLRACEFTEDPFSTSQGDTSIKVTIPLIIAQIDR